VTFPNQGSFKEKERKGVKEDQEIKESLSRTGAPAHALAVVLTAVFS
jgi:hypothetical protein